AVDDAEDRGVGADAERQGDHRDGGECRLPAQRAQGKAQVLYQHDEILLAVLASRAAFVRRAAVAAVLLHVAEAAQRFLARGRGGPSARDEVLHFGVDVKAEFLIEIGVDVAPPEAQVPAPYGSRHRYAG